MKISFIVLAIFYFLNSHLLVAQQNLIKPFAFLCAGNLKQTGENRRSLGDLVVYVRPSPLDSHFKWEILGPATATEVNHATGIIDPDLHWHLGTKELVHFQQSETIIFNGKKATIYLKSSFGSYGTEFGNGSMRVKSEDGTRFRVSGARCYHI